MGIIKSKEQILRDAIFQVKFFGGVLLSCVLGSVHENDKQSSRDLNQQADSQMERKVTLEAGFDCHGRWLWHHMFAQTFSRVWTLTIDMFLCRQKCTVSSTQITRHVWTDVCRKGHVHTRTERKCLVKVPGDFILFSHEKHSSLSATDLIKGNQNKICWI